MDLKEAIIQCRSTGGEAIPRTARGSLFVDRSGTVCSKGDGKPAILKTWMFDVEWTYEPPKQSEFEKWNNSLPEGSKTDEPGDLRRKEGWLGFGKELLKKTPARVDNVPYGDEHRYYSQQQIEEMMK